VVALLTDPLFREDEPLRRVAVCPPIHYQLRQPINLIQASHVAAGEQVSSQRAAANHAELVAALREAGAEIVEVRPDPGFPYQINTRDAGLGTPSGLILGHFKEPVRQGEEQLLERAVKAVADTRVRHVREAVFEGGDFVALDHRRAAVGIGARTEVGALGQLRKLLGRFAELIAVPLEGRYLHLDMVFNVVAERVALACASALPPDFLADLRRDGFRILVISEEEVFLHGCNVLAAGGERIISHARNGRVNDMLRAEGFKMSVVDVAELAKSGGGPRCLTLPVERVTGSASLGR
jgi:N-dimethylarginine dimethylaminohydrolase